MLEKSDEWALTHRHITLENVEDICDDNVTDIAKIVVFLSVLEQYKFALRVAPFHRQEYFLHPKSWNLQEVPRESVHIYSLKITLPGHRHFEAVLSQDFLIVVRTILRPAIRVMDAALWRRSEGYGHVQCPDRQVPLHPVAHRPTDHAP